MPPPPKFALICGQSGEETTALWPRWGHLHPNIVFIGPKWDTTFVIQEVIFINEYMTSDTKLPAYLPYPLFLLEADLTFTAKMVYMLLLDRTTLSQKNGWMDENGHIFVIFTIISLASVIKRSPMTVKNTLNELESAELIERKRQGFSAPSHIFVKLPALGQKTIPMMDRNLSFIETETCPSYGQKTVPVMDRKLSPNHVSINYVSNNHLSRASATAALALYGRYENVSLTEAELSTLQAELPDQYQHYIERLSEYMASTGKRYKNHLATIRRWAANDAKKNEPKQWIPDYTYEEGESL